MKTNTPISTEGVQPAASQQLLPMLFPEWPAPPNIRASTSTRHWQPLPQQMYALEQVHGAQLVCLDGYTPATWQVVVADGSFTSQPQQVCSVRTADCIPILACDVQGSHVAALHAGWRGLYAGILPALVQAWQARGIRCDQILLWLGPCISATVYVVGAELYTQFTQRYGNRLAEAFTEEQLPGVTSLRYYFDLALAATMLANMLGVTQVFRAPYCTFQESALLYSARRGDQQRLVSSIYLSQ